MVADKRAGNSERRSHSICLPWTLNYVLPPIEYKFKTGLPLTLVLSQQRMCPENSVVIFRPVRHTFLQQSYVVEVWFAVVEKVDHKSKMEVVLRSLEEELALVDCKAISTLLHVSGGSAVTYESRMPDMIVCGSYGSLRARDF
jgi:hypothetical protein